MSQPIVPVILCGGSGTRLWPLSRASYPKQFGRVLGEKSLFQASVARFPEPEFAAPIVVTNTEFRFIATEQLAQLGRAPGAVLIEPDGRNTAPAVLAAALKAAETMPDAFLLVCPSDHAIADGQAFRTAVRAGMRAATDGDLVTFGILPERAETGYGWLALDTVPDMDAPPAPQKLKGFVEKPDAATAQAMQADGRHLWNSGIFLFSVKAVLKAFESHQPEMTAAVRRAVEAAEPDLSFLRLDPESWAGVPDISIDYAVMEKSSNLAVVPYGGHWSDLGSWDAIAHEMGLDADDVALSGRRHAIDCSHTLLRAESPRPDPGGDRAEEHRRRGHARRGAGGRHLRRPAGQGGGRRAQGEGRQAGHGVSALPPALGLVRDALARLPLPGQAHYGASRRPAVACRAMRTGPSTGWWSGGRRR